MIRASRLTSLTGRREIVTALEVACQKTLSGRLGEHSGERGVLAPAIAAPIELNAHPTTLQGFRGAAERRATTYKRRVTKTCPTDAATTIS
jgi:hypothetical protein